MSALEFNHRQTAHCESGTVSALLRHSGVDISEPMAFGISSALLYAYIPMIKLGGLPLLAYRSRPGNIIRGLSKRLGIGMEFERFHDQQAGMAALDRHLDAGRPVGLQTSVYWLPYFPPDMRFHFNAHNLVVYARDGDEYLISDPTFEQPVRCQRQALQRARFVKGALAPRGLIYYPRQLPEHPDWRQAIRGAIKANTGMMLYTPLPIIGIRGIRSVSRKLRALDQRTDRSETDNKLLIGHMVRMQEEIGTGGGGFRFIYASFLQQAAQLLDYPELEQSSRDFTNTGDEWRRFALYAAKMCKNRMAMDYHKLADQLWLIADMEEDAHRTLRQAASKW